jgi:hypothetical protein
MDSEQDLLRPDVLRLLTSGSNSGRPTSLPTLSLCSTGKARMMTCSRPSRSAISGRRQRQCVISKTCGLFFPMIGRAEREGGPQALRNLGYVPRSVLLMVITRRRTSRSRLVRHHALLNAPGAPMIFA